MAVLRVTIPDQYVTRVETALCATFGYNDTIPSPNPSDPPLPNPETRSAFAQRMVRQYIRQVVIDYEAAYNAEAARKAAIASAEQITLS